MPVRKFYPHYPEAYHDALHAPYNGVALADAIAASYAADAAYQFALRRAGHASRWTVPREMSLAMPEYIVKVAADCQMHKAFDASRGGAA